MKIALDAMGGDFGPPNIVKGAVMALREYSHLEKLFLVGDTPKIEAELKKHACNDRRIEIVHATQVVEMTDGAVAAVRRKKDSSVSRAVDLVKKGRRKRDRQCGTHRRSGRRDHNQVAHAAWNRSSRHRGGDSNGNKRICSDRCRRQ